MVSVKLAINFQRKGLCVLFLIDKDKDRIIIGFYFGLDLARIYIVDNQNPILSPYFIKH